MTLEICVETCEQAELALSAGASRLELCSCLAVGGVSPSIGLIRSIRRISNTELVVLIRIRPGDFVYSDVELQTMIVDAKIALENGADAVAVGALTSTNEIDAAFVDGISDQIAPQKLVFHRAFDLVPNGIAAMKKLIGYQWKRILTSGVSAVPDNLRSIRHDTAYENIDGLRNLIQSANNQIEILPAGGINQRNAADILEHAGARQLHGSFSKKVSNEMPNNAKSNNASPDSVWKKDNPKDLDTEAIYQTANLLNDHS